MSAAHAKTTLSSRAAAPAPPVPVGRDFYAAANTVVIGADIGGNVYLSAENINIDDGVTIGGRLRYNSSAKISAPQSVLASAETYESKSSEPEVEVEAPKAPTRMSRVKDKIFGYVGLLLVGFGLLWLTPLWEVLDARYTGVPFGRYARAFGIGFAVLAGLPIAAILLMITGFGVRPAFVLLLVYATVLTIAPLFISFFVGVLLWRTVFKQKANYWIELPVGLLVWRILTLIPGVKFAVGLVSAPLALGVITLLLGGKKAAKAQPPVEPPVFEPAAEPPVEPTVEPPVFEPPVEPAVEPPVDEPPVEPAVVEGSFDVSIGAPADEAPAEDVPADEPVLPPEE